jgi:hypothetical protein
MALPHIFLKDNLSVVLRNHLMLSIGNLDDLKSFQE